MPRLPHAEITMYRDYRNQSLLEFGDISSMKQGTNINGDLGGSQYAPPKEMERRSVWKCENHSFNRCNVNRITTPLPFVSLKQWAHLFTVASSVCGTLWTVKELAIYALYTFSFSFLRRTVFFSLPFLTGHLQTCDVPVLRRLPHHTKTNQDYYLIISRSYYN